MVKTISARTVGEFLRWRKYLTYDKAALEQVPRPAKLGGAAVPEDLNGLTLGQLAELWSIRTEDDLLHRAPAIVLGLSDAQILKSDTTAMVGFLNFIGRESARIQAMWEQCQVTPTAEQLEAGLSSLNFGPFGLIDSWARRMRFTSHDEAAKTKWLVVWQCMKNDAQVALFERRYQQVISRKNQKR